MTNIFEWLIIILVATLVFDPAELPKLAHKAGKILSSLRRYKTEWDNWLQNLEQTETLSLREDAAKKADEVYLKKASQDASKFCEDTESLQ